MRSSPVGSAKENSEPRLPPHCIDRVRTELKVAERRACRGRRQHRSTQAKCLSLGPLRPEHRHHVWSHDLGYCRPDDGLDEYSRGCLAIRVDRKMNAGTASDVLRVAPPRSAQSHQFAGPQARCGGPVVLHATQKSVLNRICVPPICHCGHGAGSWRVGKDSHGSDWAGFGT